jgi:predicted DNA-binding transcriptional regulator AlpA
MTPGALDRLLAELADEVAARVLASLEQAPRSTSVEAEPWHLLDVEETAARLGRSTRWIRDRAKAGELPWIRLDGGALAFDLEDVRAFAAARRVALDDLSARRRAS